MTACILHDSSLSAAHTPEGDAHGVEAIQLGAVRDGGKVPLLSSQSGPHAAKPCRAVLKPIPGEGLRQSRPFTTCPDLGGDSEGACIATGF